MADTVAAANEETHWTGMRPWNELNEGEEKGKGKVAGTIRKLF